MPGELRFRILGPVEVLLDGEPIAIGGARQQALLAMLLCARNRVVPSDRLLGEGVDGHDPVTAERRLRVQVSRLRKALAVGDGERRLVARRPGYVLTVQPGELDLDDFLRLTTDAHAILGLDPERASAVLRQAEAVWTGEALAEVDGDPLLAAERHRLEELRVAAVEERITADLSLGRHSAVVPELESLVRLHPLREGMRGQFMLALYRSGRQAEALTVYRHGRERLVDELGIDPGSELRSLQAAILRQDPALLDGLARHTDHGGSVHGARRAVPTPAPDDINPPAPDDINPIPVVAAEHAVARGSGPSPGPVPARTRVRVRRWAQAVILPALMVVLALGGAAASLGPPARRAPTPLAMSGNVLVLLDPVRGTTGATIPLAAPPDDVIAAFGSLWVTETSAHSLVRADPVRPGNSTTIPLGTRPTRVAASAARVWVLDAADGNVSGIDPRTNAVVQTVLLGDRVSDMAVSGTTMWVAHTGGTISAVDIRSGRSTAAVQVGGRPSGLALDGDDVWVSDAGRSLVERIDSRTASLTGTFPAGQEPTGVAVAGQRVWTLDPMAAGITRVDTDRHTTTEVPVTADPQSMRVFQGQIWVTDPRRKAVLRINPATGAPVATLALTVIPRAVTATTGGGVWVAGQAPPPNHSGGTLTQASTGLGLGTIDPAGSTAQDWQMPLLFGLSYDGLVTFAHVSGSAGTHLVPDLAISLPAVTDAGHTLTFHLRPGLTYSNGAPVVAADVRGSFERLFDIGSSGAANFASIVGADRCSTADRPCDLTAGITTDNHSGTVTFHLLTPDPAFVDKLTYSYAVVLPAATPHAEARGWLPGTGPYTIGEYRPGHLIRLVRNPTFHEWSAVAQPAGYPDQIAVRLDLSETDAEAAVATGRADFLGTFSLAAGTARLLSAPARQRHVNPLMGTSALFLNVTAPPFDDVRVRRALNLAFDRAAAARQLPGSTPTCQVLPPTMPGYVPHCPYTAHPGASGTWTAPDLTRARRLVAASGTAGATVVVWNDVPGGEGELAVQALRALGYKATLRILPDSTFFTYTGDSRNHAQVIDGGWVADYPSPDDLLGKLTCRYFVPADGLANTDYSDFCDPAYDDGVARAAALTETDPVAGQALWAALDRRITDAAIWLPTVTPTEIDLTSPRAGNFQFHPVWGPLVDQIWLR